MRTVIGAAALLAVASAQVNALEFAQYREMPKDGFSDVLLMTMGQSYLAANLELTDAGAAPFYCQPETLAITGAQYRSILDGYVQRTPPRTETAPIEMLLLDALQETFPC